MGPVPCRRPLPRGPLVGPVTACLYPGAVSLESRAARLIADHGGPDALSITDFYSRVDRSIRTAFPEHLWITGEIRTMKVLPKGHCFIDLVDPTNARDSAAPTLNVKCWSTQWRIVRSTLDRLGITLEAGMVVRVRGEVQFYKARGSVDFILSELDTDALLGKVAAERARVIKALVDENLFDRQSGCPCLHSCCGWAWWPAPNRGLQRLPRGPPASGMAFEVTVVPTAVQGKTAPTKVAKAISNLQAEPLDVIVVVRGGGSKADLAAFDQERVARAIATSDIPVWAGIGHTGDQSVADEVANRSFITPTECGQELARLAAEYWRQVTQVRSDLNRMALEQLLSADRLLAARQRAMAIGARSQLGRHADGLGHRARTLRVPPELSSTPTATGCPRGASSWPVRPAGPRKRRRTSSQERPPAGGTPRTTAGLRGPAGQSVATAARRLRLSTPARAGLLGDPGCVRTGRPLGSGGRTGFCPSTPG